MYKYSEKMYKTATWSPVLIRPETEKTGEKDTTGETEKPEKKDNKTLYYVVFLRFDGRQNFSKPPCLYILHIDIRTRPFLTTDKTSQTIV